MGKDSGSPTHTACRSASAFPIARLEAEALSPALPYGSAGETPPTRPCAAAQGRVGGVSPALPYGSAGERASASSRAMGKAEADRHAVCVGLPESFPICLCAAAASMSVGKTRNEAYLPCYCAEQDANGGINDTETVFKRRLDAACRKGFAGRLRGMALYGLTRRAPSFGSAEGPRRGPF